MGHGEKLILISSRFGCKKSLLLVATILHKTSIAMGSGVFKFEQLLTNLPLTGWALGKQYNFF
jgi:hypothetical protein